MLVVKDRYAGQINEVTDVAGYPHGMAQNDLVEGDGFGTPLEADWVNDVFGAQQALVAEAGITPSGEPDKVGASDQLEAIKRVGGRSFFLQRGAREWDQALLPVTASGKNCQFRLLCAVPLPAVGTVQTSQRVIAAVGHDVNDGNHLVYMRSFGTGDFEESVKTTGTTSGPPCVSAGKAGEFFTGVNGGIVLRSSLGQNEGVFTTSSTPVALHYARGPGAYLVAMTDGYIDRYVGDLATEVNVAPFTHVTVPGTAGFPAASLTGGPGGEFADNGGNTVVFLYKSTVGAGFRAYYSNDGGASWAVSALPSDALITAANIAWHAAAGVFVVWDSSGKLYTSPTGATFTAITTGITDVTTANGASSRPNTFAIVGSCIAKVFSPLYYSGPVAKAAGIAYSFDLGATWRTQLLSERDAFGVKRDLTTLIASNGRLYATDTQSVFRSGVLTLEDAEF